MVLELPQEGPREQARAWVRTRGRAEEVGTRDDGV